MNDTALIIEARPTDAIGCNRAGELTTLPYRRGVGRPLAGDQVEIDASGTIARILPRRSWFGRGVNRGRFRPIAANLDQMLIVLAPAPPPSQDLLPRYLAAARIGGIEPVIVVNKTDLGEPTAAPFSTLGSNGVAVVRVRCHPEPDLETLEARLGPGIHLLVGQSGVGKTSLANALVPDLEAQTRALSAVTKKGTHTTTTARLHRLPSGGWLVDTPGVWEYGLWRMSAQTLSLGFPEFDDWAGQCRFRDCAHETEPGCAVQAAVDNGAIAEFRYTAWLRLRAEQRRLRSSDG